MIGINRNNTQLQQARCDHVFSYTTQDGVHIFKCENCPLEQRFTGDSKLAEHSAIKTPL